ncbi:MAG: hypothetical protein E6K62_06255 [Nitrospirae bacterium]|nr:MAG: hypothetical protein E6K62_06255 [Nitrospirota bacterium]
MGTFHVKFTIRNPANPERSLHLEGLVDSGAHFTQVPMTLLEQIGLIPFGTRRVQYADGTVISKPVASAEIQIGDEVTPTVILCGGPSDLILLGAFTLEGLNLGVDPVRKTLVPLIAPQA